MAIFSQMIFMAEDNVHLANILSIPVIFLLIVPLFNNKLHLSWHIKFYGLLTLYYLLTFLGMISPENFIFTYTNTHHINNIFGPYIIIH